MKDLNNNKEEDRFYQYLSENDSSYSYYTNTAIALNFTPFSSMLPHPSSINGIALIGCMMILIYRKN